MHNQQNNKHKVGQLGSRASGVRAERTLDAGGSPGCRGVALASPTWRGERTNGPPRTSGERMGQGTADSPGVAERSGTRAWREPKLLGGNNLQNSTQNRPGHPGAEQASGLPLRVACGASIDGRFRHLANREGTDDDHSQNRETIGCNGFRGWVGSCCTKASQAAPPARRCVCFVGNGRKRTKSTQDSRF